jgi:vitamin B12 transporter
MAAWHRCSFAAQNLFAFLLLTVGTTSLLAADSEPPPVPAETEARGEPLPEIPETTVVGRPGPFPTQPLSDDTLVSPTLTETRRGEAGSAVTVITEQQISQSGQTSVAEVLRGTTGADVVRQGSPGSLTSVFLRGANSQHTKVLLDGIPINDPSNATRGFDFSNLQVDDIERIEVLRGPQSVLYGSDAIGGVINIVTKRGQGPTSLRASLMGGSFGTTQESVNVSGGDDRRYYSVSGSYFDTSGISSAAARLGNPERDGYRNGTVAGRFGWTPSDLVNVDYVFRYTDARAEVDDFSFATGLPIDNLIRKNLSRQFFNRIQLQSFAVDGLVEQRVGFSLADYNRRDKIGLALFR